jgi:acyl-[acyl-carrier-protein] desaturase
VEQMNDTGRSEEARPARLPTGTMADLVAEYVEKDEAVRPSAPLDWSALAPERLTKGQRSAVRFVTLIEDHIPGYVGEYVKRFPLSPDTELDDYAHNREVFRFMSRWAKDEDLHAYLLSTYQVRAGIAGPTELREELAREGRKSFVLPYEEPVQFFAYTLIQERATQLFYQQLRHAVDEPVLKALLAPRGQDESKHYAVFHRVVVAYVRELGARLVPVVKEVLHHFKMPLADTLESYWRWSVRVSEAAGGYNRADAFSALLRAVKEGADASASSKVHDLETLIATLRFGQRPDALPDAMEAG